MVPHSGCLSRFQHSMSPTDVRSRGRLRSHGAAESSPMFIEEVLRAEGLLGFTNSFSNPGASSLPGVE